MRGLLHHVCTRVFSNRDILFFSFFSFFWEGGKAAYVMKGVCARNKLGQLSRAG